MAFAEELHKGEKLIKSLKPSRWAYLIWYLLGILSLLSFIGIIILILTELIRNANNYYITNKRIIHEYTFLSRKISSIPNRKIQDLHMTQNIIDRLFGIGTIYVNSAGSSNIEIRLKGLKNPEKVKKLIDKRIL